MIGFWNPFNLARLWRLPVEVLEGIVADLKVEAILRRRQWRWSHVKRSIVIDVVLSSYLLELRAVTVMLHMKRRIQSKENYQDLSTQNISPDAPPQQLPYHCRAAICFFLNREQREVLFGDLEKDYQDFKVEFGVKYANSWLTKETIRNLWPYVGAWFKKTGLIALFLHVVHRLLS